MKRFIIAAMLALTIAQPVYAEEPRDMKITCYCPESCPGEITASGASVRVGIAASSRDHLGDCALIWTEEGQFLGYYECLDVGGTDAIKNGYVIDIWEPNMAAAKRIMAITRGRVKVQFVENPQG